MNRIMLIILTCCLLFAGCTQPPDKRIASDSETFKVFERLFGDNYLYACDDSNGEWFIRQNLQDNYIEILAFSNRKIMRYELTESLKYTEECDSEKVSKLSKRKNDWVDGVEPCFTNGNLNFIIRDQKLLIDVGNKSGNIMKSYECALVSSTITPQIQSIVKSGSELLKVIQEDSGEFYLCSDFSLAYIQGTTCSVYRYDAVLTFPIQEEIPALVSYDFPSAFFQVVNDISENRYVLKAYGLDSYDIVVAYGDYYFCSSKDGKSQLLYSKVNNFYEWIRGE